ncbi:MAG: type II toxin-antitoxin system VapC family toxin [Gammaproteobacteria bacterium]
MILVDTSIWIDHLRRGNPALVAALEAGQVLMHPFVLGELACGTLTNRAEVLALLGKLPAAPAASESEAAERRRLEMHPKPARRNWWKSASGFYRTRVWSCRHPPRLSKSF